MESDCKHENESFNFDLPDDILPSSADVEEAVRADLEMLDNEIDKDLEKVFGSIKDEDGSESENELESEEEPENLQYMHTDGSFKSEGDESSISSVANSILHQSCVKENGLTKEDSSNETEKNGSFESSHSPLNSPASDDYNISTTEETSEKSELVSSLQDSQNLATECKNENKLLEEIMALQLQLSSVTELKDKIQCDLESCEDENKFLKEQINKVLYLYDLHNDIEEKLEKHSSRNSLNNDKLQSKVDEIQELKIKISELEIKIQLLETEKDACIKKMAEDFIAQKKSQLVIQSAAFEEINHLKLQLQHLEEEKSTIEHENSLLKESFIRRWVRSLLLWQFQVAQRVFGLIRIPFF